MCLLVFHVATGTDNDIEELIDIEILMCLQTAIFIETISIATL